jgi:hypothetical protein
MTIYKFANRLSQNTTGTSTSVVNLATTTPKGMRTLAKVIAVGANDPKALKVGDTNVPYTIEDDAGNWLEGLYTITSETQLTRTKILDSSADGADVTLSAPGTASNTINAQWLADVAQLSEGFNLSQLSNITTLSDSDVFEVGNSSGNSFNTTWGNIRAKLGSTAPTDTVAPSAPTNLTATNITQTQLTLSWGASTDNTGGSGVSYYKVSTDNATWANVGNVLTTNITAGVTAGNSYTGYVKSVDNSGNESAAGTVPFTMASAAGGGGDTQSPTLGGAANYSNVTQTQLTTTLSQAGSDDVGVVKYEVSVDTGTPNWIDNGTSQTYTTPATLTPNTQYTIRWRCWDASGKTSTALTNTATTLANAPGQVTGLTAGTSTSNSVPLTWAATSGATSYVVSYRKQGDATWTTAASNVTTPSYTVGALPLASQAYEFQVQAKNSGGSGPASATVTATTAAAAAPVYTLTGYGATPNRIKDGPIDSSVAGSYTYASYPPAGRGFDCSKLTTNGNGYWYFKKNGVEVPSTSRVVSGWTKSPNQPTAADIRYFSTAVPSPNPNSNLGASQNGLVTTGNNGTNIIDNALLWVAANDQTPNYFHACEVDAATGAILGWVLANPNGLVITGYAG